MQEKEYEEVQVECHTKTVWARQMGKPGAKKKKTLPLFSGCWILILQPHIEPTLPAFEALSINHWTMEMP